jgi:hypothetical protein
MSRERDPLGDNARSRGSGRRRCGSFTGMIWSRISRRQLPIHLSAVPFCHGA